MGVVSVLLNKVIELAVFEVTVVSSKKKSSLRSKLSAEIIE